MKEIQATDSCSESHDGSSSPATETSSARRERIKKNVLIRKNKVLAEAVGVQNNSEHSEKVKLTKQQRAELQKIKNRESAQRSRDIKKVYIQKIEAENQQLQHQAAVLIKELEELRSSKLCSKCRSGLSSLPLEYQATSYAETNSHQIQNDALVNFFDVESDCSDEARYQRIIQEEGTGKLSMLLLVCMVMIGVLTGGTTPVSDSTDNSGSLVLATPPGRLLAEIPTPQVKASGSSQLVPMENYNSVNTCFKEYEQHKKPQSMYIYNKHSLRSENPQLVTVNSYEPSDHDVLLCSVPQIIKRTQEPSLLSNIFQILMKGSEVVRVLGQSANGLSPNSLYVVLAEVKEVASYPNMNCLV